MNRKIKSALKWAGGIFAIIGSLFYLTLTVLLVVGFQTSMDTTQRWWFLVLSSITGILITMALTTQGAQLSASEEKNSKIISEYFALRFEIRQRAEWTNSMWFYMSKTFITNIFTKVLSVAASLWLVLDIVGSGEIILVVMALSNIIMYLGFGLVGLNKAYEFHNTNYMEFLKSKIKRLKLNAASVGTSQENKNVKHKQETSSEANRGDRNAKGQLLIAENIQLGRSEIS